MKSTVTPIRILHVVGHRMHWGGTETWLLRVLKNIDRTRFQMDFLVHSTGPWAFDDEVRAMGGEVITCLHPSRPWSYARRFAEILRTHGPYDVIHSHVHHFSGYIVRLAYRLGIPVRIVHSHCATTSIDEQASMRRRIYLNLMRSWIDAYATCGLAASQEAAVALYGPNWTKDSRRKVFYCGIDLEPFRTPVNREEVRRELGIPTDARVVGHVGMFGPAKNHAFLVHTIAELSRKVTNAYALLVGEGPLQALIEAEVSKMGILEQVRFCGTRGDVARLMLGAMDIFVFPSLWEGFSLALLEAQASGVPCVISDVVPREGDVVPELITRLSLNLSPSAWADTIQRVLETPPVVSAEKALDRVEKTLFSSARSTRTLEALYVSLQQHDARCAPPSSEQRKSGARVDPLPHIMKDQC